MAPSCLLFAFFGYRRTAEGKILVEDIVKLGTETEENNTAEAGRTWLINISLSILSEVIPLFYEDTSY